MRRCTAQRWCSSNGPWSSGRSAWSRSTAHFPRMNWLRPSHGSKNGWGPSTPKRPWRRWPPETCTPWYALSSPITISPTPAAWPNQGAGRSNSSTRKPFPWMTWSVDWTQHMSKTENSEVRLTAYSHGAGCGCKIAPADLEKILVGPWAPMPDAHLLVGNAQRDDAAVYDMGNGRAVISTTDFFSPIVDDAYDFGRIAGVNALSDVYAMGGRPLLAVAILGWPLEKLGAELAAQVVEGGRQACRDA